MGKPVRWPKPSTWVGGLLAALNAAFWLRLVFVTQPLPLADFADRRTPFTRTESGGMQFDMCSDCGPVFVLAGRDVGLPWFEEDPVRVFMQRSNLPGVLVAYIVATIAEGSLGYYASTWAGTCAFALASTCQWLGLGWVLGGLTSRIGRAKLKDQHH
jgi:hypothetical protein